MHQRRRSGAGGLGLFSTHRLPQRASGRPRLTSSSKHTYQIKSNQISSAYRGPGRIRKYIIAPGADTLMRAPGRHHSTARHSPRRRLAHQAHAASSGVQHQATVSEWRALSTYLSVVSSPACRPRGWTAWNLWPLSTSRGVSVVGMESRVRAWPGTAGIHLAWGWGRGFAGECHRHHGTNKSNNP